MRALVLVISLFGLTACVSPVAAPSGPPVPVGAADTCGAEPYAALVGQRATALERVLILRQVRLLRPDTATTMDYVPERINFVISTDETITAIRCG